MKIKIKGRTISEIKRKVNKKIHLKLADEIKIKHVDEIAIVPILKCNLNCIMCHQKQVKNKKEMSFEDFRIILKQLKKAKVKKISLVGGEIFVHPRMWDFIIEMERMKFKYDISSNLFYVPGIENFKYLKGLEMVTTSLDGDEEIHNNIRRNPLAYQNTTKNIKILLKDKIRVDVACVVQKTNFDKLEYIIDSVCKLNITHITCLIENSIDEDLKSQIEKKINAEIYLSSLKNPNGELTEKEFKQIPTKVKNMKEIAKKHNIKIGFSLQLLNPEVLNKETSLKNYTCSLFKGYNGMVFPDGTFNTCGFTKFLGNYNLLNNTPLEILNSEVYLKKRMQFKKYGANEMCRKCCALKIK